MNKPPCNMTATGRKELERVAAQAKEAKTKEKAMAAPGVSNI